MQKIDGKGGSPLAQAHGTYLAHDRHSANIVVNIFSQLSLRGSVVERRPVNQEVEVQFLVRTQAWVSGSILM